MSGKDRLFNLIDKGREGKNIGLSIGLPKLELYMDGLLPGTSYLIAAQSGVGKSTFSLYSFIYRPLMDYLKGQEVDRDPHFIMFNLEMTQEQIYAKLLSMYIYEHFGEHEAKEKVVDVLTPEAAMYRVGQKVVLEGHLSDGRRAAIIAYGLPLLLLLPVLFIAIRFTGSDTFGALCALGAVALYYAVISLFSRIRLSRMSL